MASMPPSPSQLLTLGMFVFGMDTMAYSDFQRRISWRHEQSERHLARPASQFTGPGEDTVTLAGQLVPEIAGTYGAIERLIEMAGTGDHWDLVDGAGTVLGQYRIVGLDQTHVSIMAGGIPRAVEFSIDLQRAD